MSAYIRIKDLHKSFHNKGEVNHVLSGIDLEINKGEIYGVVGFSGAGKSTLVRCINRLEEPDSGKVWIGDTLYYQRFYGSTYRYNFHDSTCRQLWCRRHRRYSGKIRLQ